MTNKQTSKLTNKRSLGILNLHLTGHPLFYLATLDNHILGWNVRPRMGEWRTQLHSCSSAGFLPRLSNWTTALSPLSWVTLDSLHDLLVLLKAGAGPSLLMPQGLKSCSSIKSMGASLPLASRPACCLHMQGTLVAVKAEREQNRFWE